VAAALLLSAGAAHAQGLGNPMPWDDEDAGGHSAGNMAGQAMPRGNVQAGPIRIRTSRPACLLSAGFPVLRALVEPPDAVSSVMLHFRPESYPLWYQVPMKRMEQGFVAVLPRPRPSAQRVRFFVEVMPLNGQPLRGTMLAARVVEDPAQCSGPLGETVERAAIGVKVPKGAPAVPPVPPGFEPVGTASLNRAPPRSHKAPLLVAGGFAGALAALFAQGSPATGAVTPPADEFSFLDSTPPPGSHLSLHSGPQLLVRLRLRLMRGVSTGLVRVILHRTFAPGSPCGVIEVPLSQIVAGASQDIAVSGPIMQPQAAQVCLSDRLRLQIVENGTVVASTNDSNPRDFVATYTIDP